MADKTPLISIIIPVYNTEKYLPRCLDSVVNQTFKDIEIIIVNDASQGNCKEIVEEYLKKDNRIKYIEHSENKGTYEARFSGFELSSGKYITFIDSDDYFDLDAMKLAYKKAIKTKVDILEVSNLLIISDKKFEKDLLFNKPPNKILNGNILEMFLKNIYSWRLWGKIIKRNILNLAIKDCIRNKKYLYAEDLYLCLILLYYCKSYYFFNKPLYFYDFQVSKLDNYNKLRKRVVDTSDILYNVSDFLKKKNIYDKYINNFLKIVYFIFSFIFDYDNKDGNLQNDFNYYLNLLGPIFVCKNYFSKNILPYLNLEESFKLKNIEKYKTIGFLYFKMNGGGIERVISHLSFLFSKNGYKIVVFTYEEPNENDYELPEGTVRVKLSKDLNKCFNIWKEAIEKYNLDIIIHSAMYEEDVGYSPLFFKYLGLKSILFLHSIFSESIYLNDIKRFLYKDNSYILYDSVVCLSKTDALFWKSMNFKNVSYIPNPMPANINNKKLSELNKKNIIWIGRLEEFQKRPFLALEIVSKVAKAIPEAKFFILGEGDEITTNKLKNKIKKLKIENCCKLLGKQKDIYKYLLQSSVHIITSTYEGYPMNLLEAKSCGVPTVMFDLPYLEITKNNLGIVKIKNDNIEEFSKELIKLLNDYEYRKKLSEEAIKSLDFYSNYNIMEAWEKVFYSRDNKEPENKNEINNIITELTHSINHIYKNSNDGVNEQLLPYFFSVIIDGKYTTIRIFGIKISLKNSKYYDKPIVITLSSILRNIFSIKIDKKYAVLKLLFIKIVFKKYSSIFNEKE